MLRPEPANAGKFAKSGLGGGHVDAELQAVSVPGSPVQMIRVKSATGPDGATYRAYQQVLVDSAGNRVMAMDGTQPLYKTTVDNPNVLLDSGLAAFDSWAATAAAKTAASSRNKTNFPWTGVGPHRTKFGGFVNFENGRWVIITIFPEAAWVLKL